MLLREISPSDPVSQAALDGLEYSCGILKDAQFISKTGAAAVIKRARRGTATNLITRAINTNNTPTPPTPVYDPAIKMIVSFDAEADVVLEDRNEDAATELAAQTILEAEENGYELQRMFLIGDQGAVPTDFDGMLNLVPGAMTLAANQTLPVGGDAVKNVQQLAIETLLQHIGAVRNGATHLYANDSLMWRIVTVAKNLGYYNEIQAFGETIPRIGNTILRPVGKDTDGTTYFLPFSEAGNGGNSSSIYLVRWGEGTGLTCITSVGVKGRYAGQIGNFYINNVNLDMVLHLQDQGALVRSTGWKLS